MHLKRWITGLVALPFLFLLISRGGPLLFAIVNIVICILALWEYFRIVFYARDGANQGAVIPACGHITGFFIIWAAYLHSFEMIIVLMALNLLVCTLISLSRFKADSSVSEAVAKQVLGIVYIPLFLSCLILIRNGSGGVTWIYFLLFTVFAGDVGAYHFGSYFGRHKLCPAVSPGKSVEGSISGLALNLGVGALFKHFFLPILPWGLSLLFCIAAGVAGQVGDLFESQLKRVGNIKDSGALLPGHGGILDRIDALLFAAPVAYFFKEYIL
ncbi:MAG: phosphatidate cytidylyltransferase [Desulfobacterales bacterium]|uniref:Phosphatidate cytidylyltransferase n=1 Tax=Candidatus Desulfatibia profunda TaxID=2841695 RepID=A0A8J6NU17_9BACT|nr:phosphatidate cytidylyltransferase [Candidatus Desulfatibia profunda]MBL7180078.1 phosphatidate cytidylyltransferase [Desulfobacterales bacterium]